jgi:RHS repeat-associated protein
VQSTPTDPTTNRLQSPLASYDGGGNVTVLDYGSERYEYTYDGTSMMKYLASDTGLARTFLYTAGDERAVQLDCETAGCGVDDATHTWTLRGTGAESLRIYTYRPGREWEWSKDYVHRNGKSVAAVSAGGVSHLHPDHLGTPRQITRSGGGQESLHSYYPFGQEATGAAQDDIVLKFTGHERDSNDGRPKGALDYMHARYCSPGLGRFVAVDPKSQRKPTMTSQRWNRYMYAAGDPVRLIDPNGRDVFYDNAKDRKFFERRADKNWKVRRTLAYFGPGTGRDLFIKRGDPGDRKTGKELVGSAQPEIDLLPGYDAKMRQVYDQTKGDHATKAAAADKVYDASFYVKRAVITLGPGADNSTRLHELGHVNQAIDAPLVYQAQAEEAENMSDADYQGSASEDSANTYMEEAKKNEPDEPDEPEKE